MDKQKTIFILPKKYIRYTPSKHSRDYGIYVYSDENWAQLATIFNDKDNKVVINTNIEDMTKTCQNANGSISLHHIITNNPPPKADLEINQHKFQESRYNFYARFWSYTNEDIRKDFLNWDTTITVNANLGDISINSYQETCLFNNWIFNHKPKINDDGHYRTIDITNHQTKSLVFNNFKEVDVRIEANNLKNLEFNGDMEYIDISRLSSKELETLKFPKCKKVKFDITRISCPKLKSIDFTQADKLDVMSLYDLYALFPALENDAINKFGRINKRETFVDVFDQFKKNLLECNSRKLNIDCKFIVNPNTLLTSDIFPANWDKDIQECIPKMACEIFPLNKDGNVEFTISDLIMMTFNTTKKHIYDQMHKLDSFISDKNNFKNLSSEPVEKPKEQGR